MSEKIISRQKLDALIELVRELSELPYGDEEVLSKHIDKIISVSKAIEASAGVKWSGIYDFVWGVLRGLNEDATNIELYAGLLVFGWKVQDDE